MNCSGVVESQMKLLFHSNRRSKAAAMNTWTLNTHWLKCIQKSNYYWESYGTKHGTSSCPQKD